MKKKAAPRKKRPIEGGEEKTTITVRVPTVLRDKFDRKCRKDGKYMASVLRDYMVAETKGVRLRR